MLNRFGIALLIVSTASSAPAKEMKRDVDTVLARMAQAEKDIDTLTFDFAQDTSVAATGDAQSLQGKAYFKRPDKFRIEHKAPRAQTVVSDGKNLWMHNPAQNQVLKDEVANWTRSAGLSEGLLPFQEGVNDLKKRYTITLDSVDAATNRPVLKLVPQKSGPWPYTFRVWVDESTGLPAKTEFATKTTRSVTEIRAPKVNEALAGDLFTFKTPAGATEMSAPRTTR